MTHPNAPAPDTQTLDASALDELLEVSATTWGLDVVWSPDASVRDKQIPLGQRLCVGRKSSDQVDLTLSDRRASGVHAELRREGPEAVVVEDLGSRNGTWVNGERVGSARLSAGDVLRVGGTLFVAEELSLDQQPDSVLVGRSPTFLRALSRLRRIAPTTLPVLLLGPTGTGKEVFARRLHALSRRKGRFVAVNCSAIPAELVESQFFGHKRGAFTGATADARGFFAEADGGTLFLDEVGELPAAQQPKLLRTLESQEFTPVGATAPLRTDARVVAATNVDLARRVSDGRFRADLFARLTGEVLELPALRRRRGDVLRLLRFMLDETAPDEPVEWSTAFAERLLLHDWPLNVRELKFFAQRLVLLAREVGTLGQAHAQSLFVELPGAGGPGESEPKGSAPPEPPPPPSPPRRSRRPKREELVALLRELEGNISQAAQRLGTSPKQVYRWIDVHGLDIDEFRPD